MAKLLFGVLGLIVWLVATTLLICVIVKSGILWYVLAFTVISIMYVIGTEFLKFALD